MRNLSLPDLAQFEPARPKADDKPSRLQPRIELEDRQIAGRSPNTLDSVGQQTVGLGGSFDAEPFTWQADISGDPEGTLRYSLRGEASAPFLRNRLGICVLHPMAGFAGRPCEITHVDGSLEASTFPDRISPHQPFLDIAAMSYPVGDRGRARIDFTGEVFETFAAKCATATGIAPAP